MRTLTLEEHFVTAQFRKTTGEGPGNAPSLRPHAAKHLRQPVADYFKTNIHLTSSGYFTLPPLRCALEVVGLERMMYSVDYPFSPTTRGRDFLSSAAALLGPAELEQFAHANAERLLKLTAGKP